MEDEFMCRALYSCLDPGDDEESGEAKEEQVRQEFEALGGEMKQRNQGFLNKMLLLLSREVVTSDSDVILDTKIHILLAILVAV